MFAAPSMHVHPHCMCKHACTSTCTLTGTCTHAGRSREPPQGVSEGPPDSVLPEQGLRVQQADAPDLPHRVHRGQVRRGQLGEGRTQGHRWMDNQCVVRHMIACAVPLVATLLMWLALPMCAVYAFSRRISRPFSSRSAPSGTEPTANPRRVTLSTGLYVRDGIEKTTFARQQLHDFTAWRQPAPRGSAQNMKPSTKTRSRASLTVQRTSALEDPCSSARPAQRASNATEASGAIDEAQRVSGGARAHHSQGA